MNKILERCAAQSVTKVDGELTFSKERFAELIIGECCVALSPMLRDMISRGQAYDLIKKHFGVEE